jgi:membrane protease YdiL (CAAX protease family)
MIGYRDINIRGKPIFHVFKMLGFAYGAAFLVLTILNRIPEFASFAKNSPWVSKYIGDSLAFAISILMIWHISQGKFENFGFVLKGRNLKLKSSIILGIILVLIAVLIDYITKMLFGNPINGPEYPLTIANLLGMMSFQWIFVGIFEEPLNRGLVQTYLMDNLRGNMTIFKWKFHIGTVISAIIFGLGHFGPHIFFGGSYITLVPHLILAALCGLFIGYIYQETRSLLGPILIHNIYDGFVTTIGMFW